MDEKTATWVPPVRRLRERLGYSQQKMAEKLGTNQPTIAHFEYKEAPGKRFGFLIWDLYRDELHELRITLDDLLRPWERPQGDDPRHAA